MAKTRAEKDKDRGKPPTKRSLRGAGPRGRHDPQVGVTSRARKTKAGKESVPDPKMGARPGQEHSKWRPELVKAQLKKRGLQTP
jgi:hypothetical protein